MELYGHFDEDMHIAIMMEHTGLSYQELLSTPDGVIFARSKLRRFKFQNEKFLMESR